MNWMNMIHNESVGGESDVLDTLDQELAMESKIDAEFLESETIALEGVVVKTDEVMGMLGLEAKIPTKDDIVAAGKWLLDKIKELFKKIAAAFNNLRRYGKKAKSNAEEAKKDLMAITVKDNYVDIHALENPEAFVANFDQMVKTIERYKEITEVAKGGMWTAPRGEMRKSGASSFIKELSKTYNGNIIRVKGPDAVSQLNKTLDAVANISEKLATSNVSEMIDGVYKEMTILEKHIVTGKIKMEKVMIQRMQADMDYLEEMSFELRSTAKLLLTITALAKKDIEKLKSEK